MGGPVKLELLERAVCHDTVAVLEHLLRLAKDGQITGLCYVALHNGAKHTGDVTGRACDPLLAIGLIRSLQVQVEKLL